MSLAMCLFPINPDVQFTFIGRNYEGDRKVHAIELISSEYEPDIVFINFFQAVENAPIKKQYLSSIRFQIATRKQRLILAAILLSLNEDSLDFAYLADGELEDFVEGLQKLANNYLHEQD